MKQQAIDIIHFILRLFLVLGIFVFLINAGIEDPFFNGNLMLIVTVILFLISAIIENKFPLSSTFWIDLSTRLVTFSSIWAVTLFILIFLNRADFMVIIFLINSFYLFSLLREWKFSS